MKSKSLAVVGFAVVSFLVTFAMAQTPAPAPAPKAATKAPPKAAPKAAPSQVDSVIESVKAGLSESLIIRTLQRDNKPANLSTADLVKLKNAGVSENIINVLLDPAGAPAAAAAAPAPAPAPAPVAAAPPPPPSAAPAPAPVASSAPAPSGATSQAEKKRVIIDEFDYSAVKTSVQAVFNTQQDIGKGIRAMLVTRLAQANKVVIVERAKIASLTKEQDFNASNRVKQGAGARVGQISGADALLAGDIVVFGRDDKKKSVKGGGIVGGVIGGIASSKNEDKAVVTIDYRFIDAETSEIIASGEATGESKRKSSGFGAMAGAIGKGVAGVQIDMTSSNFAQTIIGEATQDCVNKLADILLGQTSTMKKSFREVEARVADVSGRTLTINAGSTDGVNVGETFEIMRIIKELKDPVTHEVLDLQTEKTGEMTITSVRDKIATGTYAGSAVQVNFVARKKAP